MFFDHRRSTPQKRNSSLISRSERTVLASPKDNCHRNFFAQPHRSEVHRLFDISRSERVATQGQLPKNVFLTTSPQKKQRSKSPIPHLAKRENCLEITQRQLSKFLK